MDREEGHGRGTKPCWGSEEVEATWVGEMELFLEEVGTERASGGFISTV
jgi:hypothetical protein